LLTGHGQTRRAMVSSPAVVRRFDKARACTPAEDSTRGGGPAPVRLPRSDSVLVRFEYCNTAPTEGNWKIWRREP
jgi:hypothetical protein